MERREKGAAADSSDYMERPERSKETDEGWSMKVAVEDIRK